MSRRQTLKSVLQVVRGDKLLILVTARVECSWLRADSDAGSVILRVVCGVQATPFVLFAGTARAGFVAAGLLRNIAQNGVRREAVSDFLVVRAAPFALFRNPSKR